MEKADGVLLALLQGEDVLLQLHAALQHQLRFGVDIDGTDAVAVGVQVHEGRIHLGLDIGKLLFEEFQGLLGLCIAFLDILSQVRRGDFVQDFNGAIGVNILVRKFKNSGFLAFFGNAERSAEFFDGFETLELRDQEGLPCSDIGTENAEGGRVTCIREMIGLPSTSGEYQFLVLVEKLEGALGILGDNGPGLVAAFCSDFVPRHAKVAQFQTAFLVHKAVNFALRIGDEIEAHLFDCRTHHLTALDELHFRFGRAACRKQGSKATHHSRWLVVLGFNLQKGVYLINRSYPHCDKYTDDTGEQHNRNHNGPVFGQFL